VRPPHRQRRTDWTWHGLPAREITAKMAVPQLGNLLPARNGTEPSLPLPDWSGQLHAPKCCRKPPSLALHRAMLWPQDYRRAGQPLLPAACFRRHEFTPAKAGAGTSLALRPPAQGRGLISLGPWAEGPPRRRRAWATICRTQLSTVARRICGRLRCSFIWLIDDQRLKFCWRESSEIADIHIRASFGRHFGYLGSAKTKERKLVPPWLFLRQIWTYSFDLA